MDFRPPHQPRNGAERSSEVAAFLRLAKMTPWVPDISVDASIQHDNTTALFGTAYNLHAGIPIPVFDRNRGNIMSADAALIRACQEYNRTRNELATSLADSFAGYQSQRVLLDYYRTQILQDQVQSYRAIYQRYQEDADTIDFNDVVTSQQTLASAVSTSFKPWAISGKPWLTWLVCCNWTIFRDSINSPSSRRPAYRRRRQLLSAGQP